MNVLVSLIALHTLGASRAPENPGQMYIRDKGPLVAMPLERTSVNAEVAGMGARVTVRQTFVNPSSTPIEAIYTFPLPHNAAVDQMRINIGSRVIEGEIMRRKQAQKVYEAAKNNGQTAALLDQETDNIFTQSVANIMPGRKIVVEISYVELLKFEDGEFEFSFPMVVGPRFMGKGTKNPGRISPPMMPTGVRTGTNIDLQVTLHGGATIQELHSVLHRVKTKRLDDESSQVWLAKRNEIPNRDFILRYRTATNVVQDSVLTTWDNETGGYFAVVLAPPPNPAPALRSPKEMVFVIDQSGSQSGFPIDKSKELSRKLIETMGPRDQFNVMGFSNEVNPLWPESRPNTSENRAEARRFIQRLEAVGGTELEKAIVASLSPATDPERVRLVLFNTDGFAGQESVILRNVQQYRGNSRLFTFGIGNEVNRSLIDSMSYEGRGASQVVTLAEDATPAVKRFAQRMNQPVLVNVAARFDGDSVREVTPKYLPDVFSSSPVVIYGRYSRPGQTKLTVSGMSGGVPWSRAIDLDLPVGKGDVSSVASLWARARIAELKSQTYSAGVFGEKRDASKQITQIALDHNLMSEYTSFVAVDKDISNPSRVSQSVNVPVEAADGVNVGRPALGIVYGLSGGSGGGFGGGAGGGLGASSPASASAGSTRNRYAPAPATGKPATVAMAKSRGTSIADKGDVEFITLDPTDNGTVIKPGGQGRRTVAVEKGLLEVRGRVGIRLRISAVSKARLAALAKAGLKVGINDGSTLVFGSATANTIREIAKLDFVVQIERMR